MGRTLSYMRLSRSTGSGSRRERGLTMIELLACIAIVVTLTVLLLPTASKLIQRSRLVECGQRLKQLGTAFHMYAAENGGSLPTQIRETLVPIDSPDSWAAKVLPYGNNSKMICCPNSPNYARRVPNSYLYNGWVSLVNGDVDGPSNRNPRRLEAVKIGLSQTPSRDALVVDNYSAVGGYSLLDTSATGFIDGFSQAAFPHPAPVQPASNPAGVDARRNILFVDGHVEARPPGNANAIGIKHWQWPVQ